MDVVGSLIGIGIDFVPVPGVKPAFDILNFIWQNIQQASNNRDALRNLAVSAADILTAVNHVLQENEPHKPVRDMLVKLENVLREIGLFAAKHANMSLFKLLIKNVDVEGQIEFFQSRLQNLWVAFNIVALGSIGSQVNQMHQGQAVMQNDVSLPQACTPISRSKGTMIQSLPQETNSKKLQSRLPTPQHALRENLVTEVSSSLPYKLGVRENVPYLSSQYHVDEALDYWGFLTTGMEVSRTLHEFEIAQQQDSKTWKWTLAGRVISVSRHDLHHPQWKDSMDLAFYKADIAASWFSWLEEYAFSPMIAQTLQCPPASDVILRKKNSHTLMRRSATTIDFKRPTRDYWMSILGGHAQSTRDYASQFAYLSTGSAGSQVFCTVYRSGDTLVHERRVRADSLEPTVSRRYRFESETLARTWYAIWKDCAMTNEGDDEPTQVEIVTKYEGEIEFNNDSPTLTSKIWLDVNLRNWGTPKFKRSEPAVFTSFTWIYNQDRKITANAVIGSHPDWFENLEIAFHQRQSALAWFGYLTGYHTGAEQSSAPHTENVTITHTGICWMQKSSHFIRVRQATSDSWINIFGQSYKELEEKISYFSVVGTSMLPIIRVWMSGGTLHLDRRRSVDKSDGVVSVQYKFDTIADAQMWYDIWRRYFRERVASQ